jgi:hypothetical protein
MPSRVRMPAALIWRTTGRIFAEAGEVDVVFPSGMPRFFISLRSALIPTMAAAVLSLWLVWHQQRTSHGVGLIAG